VYRNGVQEKDEVIGQFGSELLVEAPIHQHQSACNLTAELVCGLIIYSRRSQRRSKPCSIFIGRKALLVVSPQSSETLFLPSFFFWEKGLAESSESIAGISAVLGARDVIFQLLVPPHFCRQNTTGRRTTGYSARFF
jgi:hypothetical protein